MTPHESEVLRGLTAEDAASVRALGSPRRLSSGAVLFDLGSEADCLYLVERGRVNLTMPMEIGGHHEDVLVEERLPGQVVGWSALIPPHRFTLKAVAPLESEVVALPRTALFGYFASRPDVGFQLMRTVGTVIGHRLQLVQAMWLREMRRTIEHRYAQHAETAR